MEKMQLGRCEIQETLDLNLLDKFCDKDAVKCF